MAYLASGPPWSHPLAVCFYQRWTHPVIGKQVKAWLVYLIVWSMYCIRPSNPSILICLMLSRVYRLPEGEKRACTSHWPTVYGNIQMWKQDVLYLATRACSRVLSDPYITACVRRRINVKHSIFSSLVLNSARLQCCMPSSPFWGVYMPMDCFCLSDMLTSCDGRTRTCALHPWPHPLKYVTLFYYLHASVN